MRFFKTRDQIADRPRILRAAWNASMGANGHVKTFDLATGMPELSEASKAAISRTIGSWDVCQAICRYNAFRLSVDVLAGDHRI